MTTQLYSTGETFVTIKTDMAETIAMDASITPLFFRLYHLFLARVNNIGHAEFKRGELLRALGTFDSDGQIIEASDSTVRESIKKLADMGIIDPKSGLRCIRVAGLNDYSAPGIRRGKSTDYCGWCNENVQVTRRIRKKPRELMPHRSGLSIPYQPEEMFEVPEEPVQKAVEALEVPTLPETPTEDSEVLESPTEALDLWEKVSTQAKAEPREDVPMKLEQTHTENVRINYDDDGYMPTLETKIIDPEEFEIDSSKERAEYWNSLDKYRDKSVSPVRQRLGAGV